MKRRHGIKLWGLCGFCYSWHGLPQYGRTACSSITGETRSWLSHWYGFESQTRLVVSFIDIDQRLSENQDADSRWRTALWFIVYYHSASSHTSDDLGNLTMYGIIHRPIPANSEHSQARWLLRRQIPIPCSCRAHIQGTIHDIFNLHLAICRSYNLIGERVWRFTFFSHFCA